MEFLEFLRVGRRPSNFRASVSLPPRSSKGKKNCPNFLALSFFSSHPLQQLRRSQPHARDPEAVPQGPHCRRREARGRARRGEQGASREGDGRRARGGGRSAARSGVAVAGGGDGDGGSGGSGGGSGVLLRRAAGAAANGRGGRAALERSRVAAEDEAEGLEDSGGLAVEQT